jgi:TolB protein
MQETPNSTMHDEVQDAYEATFARIILSMVLISLVTGLVVFFSGGITSPWFIRAVVLLIVAAVAYSIRLSGKTLIASYLLVLALFGLLAELFLHLGAITGVAPYLFIPVVAIASLLLKPPATLLITAGSTFFILLASFLTGRLTFSNWLSLVLPFTLTLLIALLVIENKRHLTRLGHLLRENRAILRERTRKIVETMKRIDEAQQHAVELERRLALAKVEVDQARSRADQTDNQLYRLIQTGLQEAERLFKSLEQELEQVAELPNLHNQATVLEPIWRRIDHLRGFLVQLEAMLQVERADIELTYEAVDIRRLMSEVTGVTQGLAGHKPIAVQCLTPEKLPLLPADPLRLRLALLQVLSNAVNYTDEGSITIQVKLTEKEDEVWIVVSDTGRGIRPGEHLAIFEQFWRGSNNAAGLYQGAGLGLALAKRLLELHGGRIWAANTLGPGSTFYMALPLKPKPKAAPALARPQPQYFLQVAQAVEDDLEQTLVSIPALKAGPPSPAGRAPAPAARPLPANDPDKTLVSTRPGLFYRPHVPPDPVRRYGHIYVRRFSMILLSLLLMISAVVAILAALNGVNEPGRVDPTQAAALPVSVTETQPPTPTRPSAPGGATSASVSITAATPVDSPTASPTATSSAMPTPTLTAAPSTLTPAPAPSISPPTSTATPSPPPMTTSIPTSTLTPVSARGTLAPPTFISAVTRSLIVGSARLSFAVDRPVSNDDPTARLNQASRLSWSPAGQLLFSGEQGAERDIYRVEPEALQPLRLTSAPGDDLQPAWSPDGRQIAFSSGRAGNLDIYVMEANGARPRPLTDSPGFDEWPAWSPDGRQIAFVSDRDGNVELYLMNADGRDQQRLTNHSADDWPPAWSPDGLRLVFASNRDGDWNLYILDLAGGPPLRLTNAAGDERDPAWSPDGRAIAFAYNGGGNWDIYFLPVSATSVTETPREAWTRITDTPGDERYPSWQVAGVGWEAP